MSTREFFQQRWESEQPAFGRVLRALPADRLDYQPHERSSTAGNLAWQLALEQGNLVELFDTGTINFEMKPAPSLDEIVAYWDKATAEIRERFANVDDGKWAGPAKFAMGGKVVWETTVDGMCWGYLFDMVHHRGQLSAYLRPMGGKVPSIYGPSADDSGA
jgi:uncharacterized damage-inducible protein DinB